jgi:hypothetical protein
MTTTTPQELERIVNAIDEMDETQAAAVFWAIARAFTDHGRELRFAITAHTDADQGDFDETFAQLEAINIIAKAIRHTGEGVAHHMGALPKPGDTIQ